MYSLAMMQNNEVEKQVATIKNAEAISVPEMNIDKVIAKEIYKKIKQRKNKYTEQIANFVNNTFNKILGHKGFDIRIILILAEAYENAIYMYDEPVNNMHKKHTNFTGYSNYVAKISIKEQPIYARFTLENLKTKPGKEKVSQFHSVHLSYEVKNNATQPCVNSAIITTATWGVNGTTDLKLLQWLNSVK